MYMPVHFLERSISEQSLGGIKKGKRPEHREYGARRKFLTPGSHDDTTGNAVSSEKMEDPTST